MTALMCLATAIFFEARNQEIDAQLMVAQVVINRVESEHFPNTVCDVVYESKQFSFTLEKKRPLRQYKGTNEESNMELAILLAKVVLTKEYRAGLGSRHYHTSDVNPVWAKKMKRDGRYGDHIFYTCTKGVC